MDQCAVHAAASLNRPNHHQRLRTSLPTAGSDPTVASSNGAKPAARAARVSAEPAALRGLHPPGVRACHQQLQMGPQIPFAGLRVLDSCKDVSDPLLLLSLKCP